MREKHYIAIITDLLAELQTITESAKNLVSEKNIWIQIAQDRAREVEQLKEQLAEANNFKTVAEAAKA